MDRFLVVGLGNPGASYDGTRHNVGFAFIDKMAKHLHWEFREKSKFRGWIAEGKVGEVSLILLKPSTFMNLSGESVAALADYYQISPSRILIVTDDVDIPFGELRLKINSGPGTHNGLKNVELCLHTNRYARLRVGVGAAQTKDLADFVLSQFSAEESNALSAILQRAMEAVEIWLSRGITRAMDFANMRYKNPSNPSNGE